MRRALSTSVCKRKAEPRRVPNQPSQNLLVRHDLATQTALELSKKSPTLGRDLLDPSLDVSLGLVSSHSGCPAGHLDPRLLELGSNLLKLLLKIWSSITLKNY